MSGIWGVVGPLAGALVALLSGWWAARATKGAAAATAEAHRAAAQATAEPNQRAADLAAFREIRTGLEQRLEQVEARERSLRSLVRSFAFYVNELTAQMRGVGLEPPAPPSRIDEYNRTGV
ncbi:hypothetical protein GCM10010406_52830 [Streptomyces thermolineatus]|uniref:Secreted protein n=1 Tax=Streptomyces thermolineatus TaxID=44033 RepID=A0ABN3MVV1_9ACTN